MSSATNIKAILLRMNCDHSVRCSATHEKSLVAELDRLWDASEFSRANVERAVSQLPAKFFTDNKLDSASQYADLLWDALSIEAKGLQPAGSTSVTHFHGPVQTQILQTGAHSQAQISQRSQRNQSYTQVMKEALSTLRDTANVEITKEADRKEALTIISDAERENSQSDPDKGKIQDCLSALGKWTGERFTKAVDAAIEVGVKYGLTGSAS